MSFGLPEGKLIEPDGSSSTYFKQWLSLVHTTIFAYRQSGTTADRPTKLLWVGRRYFDTTLGIPVWYEGSGWVDATGASV